nr:spore germination protein [Acetohalobium arabaticum]
MFLSYLESFIMEFSLELLREAGIRLPGPIGQTIGVVGGLSWVMQPLVPV